jgi:hypothetical protein
MRTILVACFILAAVQASFASEDLTGRWSCNDGGTYYLRQAGSRIHWYAEAADAQPAWSHVFSGRIHDGRIEGNWTDVPKGRTAGSGTLSLAIENDGNALRVLNKTAGFGGSRWTRRAANTAVSRPVRLPRKPSGKDNCMRFNPTTLSVEQMNGRWRIVDGDHWLFDFGPNRPAARQALKVIRHYRIDRSCTVGRQDASFSYLMANSGSPTGAMAGEDCVAFEPKTLAVSKRQGRWKIVSGGHWLFDFGQSETAAHQALALIRRHGFNRSCFVGRPDADFPYLRR